MTRAPASARARVVRRTAALAAPSRLLVIAPSWVGDAVMATPSFRLLRELMRGTFIGALVRPGIDRVLDGAGFFDEMHIARPRGVLGPLRVAANLRRKRYDTALIFPGSFSSALTASLSGAAMRIGYERDGRGILLTDRLTPAKRKDVAPFRSSGAKPDGYAPVPARLYYAALVSRLLGRAGLEPVAPGPMELVCTRADELEASGVLERAGIAPEDQRRVPFVMINPGANREDKRWPAGRFAALADELARHNGVRILINTAPAETELSAAVAASCSPSAHPAGPPIELVRHGMTLGTLKGIVKRCRLMVTNDTGPRHMAAAFGVPVVSLFGPTDPRWTETGFEDEIVLTADPSLPPDQVADDHPERCRIERIGLGDAVHAATKLLRGTSVH